MINNIIPIGWDSAAIGAVCSLTWCVIWYKSVQKSKEVTSLKKSSPSPEQLLKWSVWRYQKSIMPKYPKRNQDYCSHIWAGSRCALCGKYYKKDK